MWGVTHVIERAAAERVVAHKGAVARGDELCGEDAHAAATGAALVLREPAHMHRHNCPGRTFDCQAAPADAGPVSRDALGQSQPPRGYLLSTALQHYRPAHLESATVARVLLSPRM